MLGCRTLQSVLELSTAAPLRICTAAGAPVEPHMLPGVRTKLLLEGLTPDDHTPGSDSLDLDAKPPPAGSSPIGAIGTQASQVSALVISVSS